MKLSDFAEIFLAALYNETQISGRSKFTFGEIFNLYSLSLEPIWADKIVHDSFMRAYCGIKNKPQVDLQNQDVELSASGLRHIENKRGENVSTFLESVGVVRRQNTVQDDNETPFTWTDVAPPLEAESVSVDSSRWTGQASRYVISEQTKRRIVQRMSELNKCLDDMALDQSQRAQAGAMVSAVLLMAEAPQPPWEIIKDVLTLIAAIAAPLSLALQIGQMIS